MFLVIAIIAWTVVLGLAARRFGPVQEALLVAGIVAAMAAQFFIFGPS